MLKSIVSSLLLQSNKMKNSANKSAPELYLAGGLIAGAVTIALTVRAVKQHQEKITPLVYELSDAREELDGNPPMDPGVATAAVTPIITDIVKESIKTYAPPVLTAAVTVMFILKSHGLLRDRNNMLAAAATAAFSTLNEYRGRVVTKYGEEVDNELYNGVVTKTRMEKYVDEDGNEKSRRVKYNAIGDNPDPLMYSRVFDEHNPLHSPDREINTFLIGSFQTTFNDLLAVNGFVMLNDVLAHLQFARTPVGAVVGWSLKSDGDNFIDFGLDKSVNADPTDNRFVLDFNVNGVVYDLI